jgi:hypothetical protein
MEQKFSLVDNNVNRFFCLLNANVVLLLVYVAAANYCMLQLHTHEIVEVCAKILYQVELQRTTLEQMWGFSVEAELIENADRQDELCCYVSRVEDKSVAMQNGELRIEAQILK